MEAITHILTGVLIQIICFIYFVFPFNVILTIVFAFLSHFLIDTLAKATYHTPEPHKEDKFWVIWHIITLSLLPIVIIWIVLIDWSLFFFFLLGAIAANLVDIWDWMILRPKHNKFQSEHPEEKFWGENLYLHSVADWLREKPFFWLPNLNEDKRGVLGEILTISILWILVIYFLPQLNI